MGFFSWNCKGCGKSIKAPYDIPKELEWHNKITVVLPDGVMMGGDYDGYGRIITDEIVNSTPFQLPTWGTPQADVWHDRCHEEAGSPTAYTGGSESAPDQGFFYAKEGDTDDLR